MKTIALIPARYDSQRFPGKLMQDLGGKTVIKRTYEAVVSTGLFDSVWVATDSPEIEKEIKDTGGLVFNSQKAHECGSDRIAEAAECISCDLILNVQGDEPFMDRDSLSKLIAVFKADTEHAIAMASLMVPIAGKEEINDKDVVKVIVDLNSNALYFSRAVIPFDRDGKSPVLYHRHLGVYAFRREALIAFSKHPPTPLEIAERIECIRFLEMGKKIKMVRTNHVGIGIDNPMDLEKARAIINH